MLFTTCGIGSASHLQNWPSNDKCCFAMFCSIFCCATKSSNAYMGMGQNVALEPDQSVNDQFTMTHIPSCCSGKTLLAFSCLGSVPMIGLSIASWLVDEGKVFAAAGRPLVLNLVLGSFIDDSFKRKFQSCNLLSQARAKKGWRKNHTQIHLDLTPCE